jgi:hypothetical protein
MKSSTLYIQLIALLILAALIEWNSTNALLLLLLVVLVLVANFVFLLGSNVSDILELLRKRS